MKKGLQNMVFGKKKTEKPKSQLGLALFNYDNIFKSSLEIILKAAQEKKKLNPKRTYKMLEAAFNELEIITENISKNNFKTDYRSDKIRDIIIGLVNLLKHNLNKSKSFDYDFSNPDAAPVLSEIEKIPKIREDIKKRMKDIESDYI
ncbi:MAG: hypothetical protein JW997_06070 [Actinobacteria bacterium]|nr:hypothetical protein [Actinomycetota bacterium]